VPPPKPRAAKEEMLDVDTDKGPAVALSEADVGAEVWA
jgi:hypothetical protein